MIEIEPHADGCLLMVRARAGARRNEVRGEAASELKVCVKQIAERGKANAAIRDELAKWLGLHKTQIQLFAGATSSRKKFLIRTTSPDELRRRIDRALAESLRADD